jgi:hypothetical protein
MSKELVGVPKSVPTAIAALKAMERDLSSVKKFDEIRSIERRAEVLKHLFDEVEWVRDQAELMVILAKRRIR